MTKFRKVLRTILLVMVCSLMLTAFGIQAETNDDVRLKLRVGYVFAYSGEQMVPIHVNLANYDDTVNVFSFFFRADHPDLCSWQIEIDTVGTLSSGWYSVQAIFVGMGANMLRVVGESQAPFGGPGEPLAPQESPLPLFLAHMAAATISDTTSNCQTQIHLLQQPTDLFVVLDNYGSPIGMTYTPYLDSNYYLCDAWDEIDPEQCLSWSQVSGPPYDSIAIYIDSIPNMDTNLVTIEPGTFTVVRCGNFDGSSDNKINLADITAMISYVYLNGDEPPVLIAANVDASANGAVNLADITKLIGHVYMGTGPLSCE